MCRIRACDAVARVGKEGEGMGKCRRHRGQVAVSVGWRHSQAFMVARTVGESRELAPGEWAWSAVTAAEALAQMVRHRSQHCGRQAPPEMSLPEISRGCRLEVKRAKSVKWWHLRRWAPPEMGGGFCRLEA
jgi:hypothetical protein